MVGSEREASDVEIRRATALDADDLARMRAASSHERKGGDEKVRDEHARLCHAFFARELGDPRTFLRSWVASVEGGVVGGASLLLLPTMPRYGAEFSGYDGRVRDVFVESAYRSRGIGRALMAAVLAEAKSERVGRLTLGASEMGQPLYLALGFVFKRDEMEYMALGQ